MAETRERGRPPLPRGRRKDATIRVRLRPEDKARLQSAAEAADKNLSDWARDVLLSALKTKR